MKPQADDLPPDLTELLAAERQAPRPSLEAERRVRGRLTVTLAATAAGSAALAGSSAAAATAAGTAKAGGLALGLKLSLAVVGISAMGTAGSMAWYHQQAAKPAAPPAADVQRRRATVEASPPLRAEAAAPDEVEATVLAPPVAAATPPAPPAAPKHRVRPTGARRETTQAEPEVAGSLAAESPLIEGARSSVTAQQPTQALALLAEHQRQFPHGQLEEEREALWVQALVASGDGEQARARAERFRQRFPRSIQLPVVAAAIATIP